LRELDSLAPGQDAQSLFDGPQPLEVEIGSGKGLFLLNQSAATPNHNLIGIEIAKKYARFAAYRLAKHGRTNARVIRGDGLRFCREHLPDTSVTAFHVYFPDPWWKDRHRKRRVIQPDFIQSAVRTLLPGGKLVFWTDVEEYFESGCEQIRSESNFAGPFPDVSAAVTSVSEKHADLEMVDAQFADRPSHAVDTERHLTAPLSSYSAVTDEVSQGRTHFDLRMMRNAHEVFRAFFVKPVDGK
jgi:tRNA (guanine-N7-)-methyltransferase